MAEKVLCPKCSVDNFSTSTICWQCGTPLKQRTAGSEPTPYPPQGQTPPTPTPSAPVGRALDGSPIYQQTPPPSQYQSPYPGTTTGPVSPPPVISRAQVQSVSRPALISAASILGIVFYLLRFTVSLVFMIGGAAISRGSDGASAGASVVGGTVMGLGGLLMVFAVVGIVAGVRLWQGYAWARAWLLGLGAILLIRSVLTMISGKIGQMGWLDWLTVVFALFMVIALVLQDSQDYCTN